MKEFFSQIEQASTSRIFVLPQEFFCRPATFCMALQLGNIENNDLILAYLVWVSSMLLEAPENQP